MNRTECNEIGGRLVDCARSSGELDLTARVHLVNCEKCSDRWEAEIELASQFRALQAELGGRRSAYARRTELLRKFDAEHPRQSLRPWWSLAAAAALLFTVGVGVSLRYLDLQSTTPSSSVSEVQADMQEAGFIAVPFVPPLAPGELLHIIHTQLQPAELASFGVNVDPTLSADLPADLLVGADGFPRAVRISEEVTGDGGN